MNKQELLQILEEGLKIEEEVIPIYSHHINNTLFLSGLTAQKTKTIGNLLDVLKKDSERHRQLFNEMIQRVKESSVDVY